MDTFLQVLLVIAAVPCIFITVRRTGSFLNPVTLMAGLFFLPMFFATFRLSGLQSPTWNYNTYAALIASVGAWLIVPTIVIACFYKKCEASPPKNEALFIWCYRFFSLLVVVSYFAGNYVQAKLVLPVVDPNVAFAIHDEFPGGIRFFARATPAAAILAYIAFFHYRRKLDLLIYALLLLTPLSRLSRIDPAITIVGTACLYAVMPIFKAGIRSYIVILISVLALVVAGSELGNQRQNRFGTYEFKYLDMIKWRSDLVGPSEVLPVLYGYTSLSFENLDATISTHNGRYTYALYSFDWLYSGFLKLNWFTPYELAQYENFQRTIVSGAATVPTALFPFYADFGPIGIIMPTLLYMAVLLLFYLRRQSSVYVALYSLYAGAFGLASFQALVASSPIVQQLAWIVIIFAISNKMTAKNGSKNASAGNTGQLASG